MEGEDRAWDDHASAGDHTSDVADGGVAVVVTFHPCRLGQGDAYDADLAGKSAVAALSWDRDDTLALASFHLVDQHHCFHCSAATLCLYHADQRLTVVE